MLRARFDLGSLGLDVLCTNQWAKSVGRSLPARSFVSRGETVHRIPNPGWQTSLTPLRYHREIDRMLFHHCAITAWAVLRTSFLSPVVRHEKLKKISEAHFGIAVPGSIFNKILEDAATYLWVTNRRRLFNCFACISLSLKLHIFLIFSS